jgi:hypothetical protein
VESNRDEHEFDVRRAPNYGECDGRLVLVNLRGRDNLFTAGKRTLAAIVAGGWPALASLAAIGGLFRKFAAAEAVEWLEQQEDC